MSNKLMCRSLGITILEFKKVFLINKKIRKEYSQYVLKYFFQKVFKIVFEYINYSNALQDCRLVYYKP